MQSATLQGNDIFNCSVTWNADGELLAKYRTMHLFRLNTEKVKFDEGETLTAGDSLATFDVGSFKVGMGICFDVRYGSLISIKELT
jgi:omega-amidase